MKIKSLSVSGFRNLKPLNLSPNGRFNIFCGQNAQGKTNILEAIFLLGSLQSFKGSRNTELIQWDQESATIRGAVEKHRVSNDVLISISRAAKRVKIDGKTPRTNFDYFGMVNVVLFSPEDLRITKGEPDARRRFLDRAIFNADANYLQQVKDYQRVLKQRNALLKDGHLNDSLLEIYDVQLADYGAMIIDRRQRFLAEYKDHFGRAFRQIVGGEQQVVLEYKTKIEGDDLQQAFLDLLQSEHRKDQLRGATSSGPHVDDLAVSIDDRQARIFASQGQHRALVLALKIGEMSFLMEKLGFYPILLLDDVSSELDHLRNKQLLAYLQSIGGQVFITTTDPSLLGIRSAYTAYNVAAGEVSETSI